MATNDVFLRQDAGDGTNGVRLRPDAPDSVAYTLPGAAGTYVVSGQVATLIVGRRFDGAAGSYAVTGQAATLTYHSGSGFPTQYLGLKVYYHATVNDLCLVAEADANTGMGGAIVIDKNGTNYAVYLVDTTDPDASPIRVETTTGIKAIRVKT